MDFDSLKVGDKVDINGYGKCQISKKEGNRLTVLQIVAGPYYDATTDCHYGGDDFRWIDVEFVDDKFKIINVGSINTEE